MVLKEFQELSNAIEKDIQAIYPSYSLMIHNIDPMTMNVNCADMINSNELFSSSQSSQKPIPIQNAMENSSLRESLSPDWLQYEVEQLENQLYDRIQYLKKKESVK